MMARASMLRELGGFDYAYFYGYEDSDLGWRANLAGYRVAVFPQLVATHHVDPNTGASDPRIVFHYTKNRLRSVIKNYGLLRLCTIGAASMAVTLADGVLRAPHAPKLNALVWNTLHLGATLRARRAIQATRRRSDAELTRFFTQSWLPPTRLAGRRRRPAEKSDSVLPVAPAHDDRVH
jgi:GT2 family glycosyltransferase